jgi:hypothetical protein
MYKRNTAEQPDLSPGHSKYKVTATAAQPQAGF